MADALRRPRRWIAVLLSLLMPGTGHVYAGYLARGAVLFASLSLVAALIGAVFSVAPFRLAVFVGLLCAAVIAVVLVAIDAARTAGRGRVRFTSAFRIAAATLAFLLLGSALERVAGGARDRFVGAAYRIATDSMAPTLLPGDYLMTRPFLYHRRAPRRGDIVVVRVPRKGDRLVPADADDDLSSETVVKRIVAIPRDTVRFEGGVLYLNGVRATGSMQQGTLGDDAGPYETIEERIGDRAYKIALQPGRELGVSPLVRVEAGRYFVVGDNRAQTDDSRQWGTVDRADLLAPTGTIYWSWDDATRVPLNPIALLRTLREQTRWERIGVGTNWRSGWR